MTSEAMEEYKQQILQGRNMPIRLYNSRTNEMRLLDPAILDEPGVNFNRAENNSTIDRSLANKNDLYQPFYGGTSEADDSLEDEDDIDNDEENDEDNDNSKEYSSEEGTEYDGIDEDIAFMHNNLSSEHYIRTLSNEENASSRSKNSKDLTNYTRNLLSSDEDRFFKEIWDKESPLSQQGSDADLVCDSSKCQKCTSRLIA